MTLHAVAHAVSHAVTQVFKLEDVPTAREHLLEKCSIPGLSPHAPLQKVSIGGDVAFTGYPHSLSASFAENGETYAGSRSMMDDPVASPMKVHPVEGRETSCNVVCVTVHALSHDANDAGTGTRAYT